MSNKILCQKVFLKITPYFDISREEFNIPKEKIFLSGGIENGGFMGEYPGIH